MIRGFEPNHPLEPESQHRMQWGPAIGAGLIAGRIFLVVPRGSPWSALTFVSPVVLGRDVPPAMVMPLLLVWMIHLLVSIVYGLIISRIVARLTQGRAILTGGLAGLLLYVINLAIVSVLW